MRARRISHAIPHPAVWCTVAIGMLIAGCEGAREDASPAELTPPKNVLIVLMDATVATHMYPWGYDRDPAPNFRKIARDGMLFLNAHSQGANTTPSVWSFMTGRTPYVPEPLDTYTTHRPYESDFMMAQAFQSAGFRTGAFVENPWIHSKYGWAKGFDGFKDVPALYDHQGERWSRLPDATKHTLDFAQEWIDAQGDDAWFCYVHLIRPHDPYDAPVKYTAHYTREPYRDHDHPRAEHRIREAATADPNSVNQDDIDYLTDMYDANLRYVDALVGDFYESLKRQGALDDTLIVLMSDHGEAFGEHGKLGHNTTAYEEMVHVPLAIVAPEGHGFAKGAYSGLVDLVDLMPTFAELYGLSAPTRLAGVSLAPALHRRADTGRHHSVSHSAFDHFQVAWREGDLKLIAHVDPNYSEVQSYEVFNLEADPMERHDLSRDESIAGPLLSAVREYLGDIERKDTSGDPTLEPDDLEQLRALGYGKTD